MPAQTADDGAGGHALRLAAAARSALGRRQFPTREERRGGGDREDGSPVVRLFVTLTLGRGRRLGVRSHRARQRSFWGLGGGLSAHSAGDSRPSPGVRGARKDGPGISPGHSVRHVSPAAGLLLEWTLTNPVSLILRMLVSPPSRPWHEQDLDLRHPPRDRRRSGRRNTAQLPNCHRRPCPGDQPCQQGRRAQDSRKEWTLAHSRVHLEGANRTQRCLFAAPAT